MSSRRPSGRRPPHPGVGGRVSQLRSQDNERREFLKSTMRSRVPLCVRGAGVLATSSAVVLFPFPLRPPICPSPPRPPPPSRPTPAAVACLVRAGVLCASSSSDLSLVSMETYRPRLSIAASSCAMSAVTAEAESYRPRPSIAASSCAISAVIAEWASRWVMASMPSSTTPICLSSAISRAPIFRVLLAS